MKGWRGSGRRRKEREVKKVKMSRAGDGEEEEWMGKESKE